MIMKTVFATAGLILAFAASPAAAQDQQGLVNVNCVVCGTNAQVAIPVGVAAQVCGVDANIIAEQREEALTSCTIDQQTVDANQSLRSFVDTGGQGGGQGNQEGLVNVNCVVCGTNAQVAIPIGVAAQVCGVDANVIAQQREAALTECQIDEQTVEANQALQNIVRRQ
jgi:hypothetical protein